MTQENLSNLSNQELDVKLKSLVSRERELFSEILLHICEVDRRKLYLNFSYGSLFDYLTAHLGYSAGSAQRRIDACRLSYEVPGVIEDLQSGALNLSQVSLVQKSFRQAQASKNQPLEFLNNKIQTHLDTTSQGYFENKLEIRVVTKALIAQAKNELLESLKEKSFSESQAIVAKALDINIKAKPVTATQSDGSTRLEVTFSKEEWEMIVKMRELLSHSLPNGSWDQVFLHVAKKVIASKTNVRNLKRADELNKCTKEEKVEATIGSANKNKKDDRIKSTSNLKNGIRSTAVSITETRKVGVGSAPLQKERSFYQNRKILLMQNSCCQYQDKITKRTCTSKWQLQVDHIKPQWAGGTDEISNLRILCGMHNRAIYREQANIRSVR